MARRSFRLALLTVLASLAVVAVLVFWGVHEIRAYGGRHHPGSGRDIPVEITRGMRFPEVTRALLSAGIIDRPSWFRLYAMHHGLANKVRAGKYTLKDNLSPREVLEKLTRGVETLTVKVTIPEGTMASDLFAELERQGVASQGELDTLSRDPVWLKDHGISGATAEGYLFPDTYLFKKPDQPREVLEKLVTQHRVVYDELRRRHVRSLQKLQKQLGWGDHEIVIMASIIEKEAVVPQERPTIASVFYNRLTQPSFRSRRLETDPTIRYGCTVDPDCSQACREWFDAGRPRLRRAQLDDRTNPYNTYQHPSLPPGPISNPGRASLEAAMAPSDSDFLFFVARDERHHVFSRTLEEHGRNVAKYQR